MYCACIASMVGVVASVDVAVVLLYLMRSFPNCVRARAVSAKRDTSAPPGGGLREQRGWGAVGQN